MPGTPLFIDTDTASDDAVALMMAFAHRGPDIVGLGIVAGNCPLEPAVQNALYVAELCGASVPVHAGAAAPLSRALDTAQHVHGVDGMGDIGLPLSGRSPSGRHAALALIEAATARPGELELVTLGPLTNIALALRLEPRLAQAIGRCVVMGGTSDYVGNMTPVSEYNIWADPEAAEIVFASGLPITMVGWDISRKHAEIDDALSAELRAIGTRKAEVAIDCQATLRRFCEEVTGVRGFDLPDPIAMAVAIDGAVATRRVEAAVHVACNNDLTRGQTIIDASGMTGRAKIVSVVTEASTGRFLDLLRASLR